MVFSSFIFLWFFLPLIFIAGMIIKAPGRQNILLLLGSLLFYAWGEPVYILLLLASILLNYLFGLGIGSAEKQNVKKLLLTAALVINLGSLACFKYLGLLSASLAALLPSAGIPVIELPLPVGISFFTFQAMAYIIDLYRGKYPPQKDPLKLALYISFFPQLIAGPIVRYIDIEKQLTDRKISLDGVSYGIRRFIYGLAKKVLIANTLADAVDRLLSHGPSAIGTAGCWFCAIAYTLQIYYDFSGYSDMAIGLGRIFGFEFRENFDLPYISRSISEFWRRWHISLGEWFREYLYIPLGGNRKGKARSFINLFIVFALTGFWHGASWRFMAWGIYHGAFRIIEKAGFEDFLKKHPVFSHIYTIIIFTIGWVIFRADSLGLALEQIKQMFIPAASQISPGIYTGNYKLIALAAGIFFCGPAQKLLGKQAQKSKDGFAELACCAVLAGLCILCLGGESYNPFIYFRF